MAIGAFFQVHILQARSFPDEPFKTGFGILLFEQFEIMTRTLVDRADLFKTADKLPQATVEVSNE